ncbi:MAG: hypothetical protein Q8K65_02250 [Alphaproteobacteria bacterium]|nr:hypothetical protein [Alphaproteobacteria bacterium]
MRFKIIGLVALVVCFCATLPAFADRLSQGGEVTSDTLAELSRKAEAGNIWAQVTLAKHYKDNPDDAYYWALLCAQMPEDVPADVLTNQNSMRDYIARDGLPAELSVARHFTLGSNLNRLLLTKSCQDFEKKIKADVSPPLREKAQQRLKSYLKRRNKRASGRDEKTIENAYAALQDSLKLDIHEPAGLARRIDDLIVLDAEEWRERSSYYLLLATERKLDAMVLVLLQKGADPRKIAIAQGGILEDLSHARYRVLTPIEAAEKSSPRLLQLFANFVRPITSGGTTYRQCPKETRLCENNVLSIHGGEDCAPDPCTLPQVTTDFSARSLDEILADLRNKNTSIRHAASEWVLVNAGSMPSAILQALSDNLFRTARDEEAMFWAMAAQMRMNYERMICKKLTPKHAYEDYHYKRDMISSLPLYLNKERLPAMAEGVFDWATNKAGELAEGWAARENCLSPARAERIKGISYRSFVERADKIMRADFGMRPAAETILIVNRAKKGDPEAQYEAANCFLYTANTLCADFYQYHLGEVLRDIAPQDREARAEAEKKLQEHFKKTGQDLMEKSAAQQYKKAQYALAENAATKRDIALKWIGKGDDAAYLDLAHFSEDRFEKYAWASVAEARGVQFAALTRIDIEARLDDADFAQAQAFAQKYTEESLRRSR